MPADTFGLVNLWVSYLRKGGSRTQGDSCFKSCSTAAHQRTSSGFGKMQKSDHETGPSIIFNIPSSCVPVVIIIHYHCQTNLSIPASGCQSQPANENLASCGIFSWQRIDSLQSCSNVQDLTLQNADCNSRQVSWKI